MNRSFTLAPAVEILRRRVPGTPRIAIVLGSGLGALEHHLDGAASVPYSDVPGLPDPGVAGHGGRFVFGRLNGRDVVLVVGRLHAYEGHDLAAVVAPVRIACRLGAHTIVLTNAAGGIRSELEAGDLVILDDQINFTLRSPLIGPVGEGETRVPDMSAPFDIDLQRSMTKAAARLRLPVHRGVYGGVLGPAYETAAEVRMLARLGADVVGMSTVPEVIAARALGARVGGLSLVTNRATGRSDERLSHDEVLAAGADASERMIALLSEWVVEPGPTSEVRSD